MRLYIQRFVAFLFISTISHADQFCYEYEGYQGQRYSTARAAAESFGPPYAADSSGGSCTWTYTGTTYKSSASFGQVWEIYGELSCNSNIWRQQVDVHAHQIECPVCLTHETGGPSFDDECPQSCALGYILDVFSIAPFDCMIDREPGECRELGESEVQTSAGSYCVSECPNGSINGVCLPPPEEPQECTSDSPDYRGQLVLGYGKPPIPACGDFDQCTGDIPGQVGVVNGELRCIPEDYGIPQCKDDSITVVDEYGFVCEPLSDVPDKPETPEDPNTDTDGDGEPDEYRRENDPESIDKGLDRIGDRIGDTNQKLDGANKRLDKLGKGVDDANKQLRKIEKNTGDTVTELRGLNDKLEAPEGGLSTDGLGDAPTFSDSVARLKLGIFEHPTIQTVTTIPTIGTSTSCPTWTIPANDYWDALTMDVHCSILEDYRSTFSVMFLFFWTIVAIFLFLRA